MLCLETSLTVCVGERYSIYIRGILCVCNKRISVVLGPLQWAEQRSLRTHSTQRTPWLEDPTTCQGMLSEESMWQPRAKEGYPGKAVVVDNMEVVQRWDEEWS